MFIKKLVILLTFLPLIFLSSVSCKSTSEDNEHNNYFNNQENIKDNDYFNNSGKNSNNSEKKMTLENELRQWERRKKEAQDSYDFAESFTSQTSKIRTQQSALNTIQICDGSNFENKYTTTKFELNFKHLFYGTLINIIKSYYGFSIIELLI